MVKKESPIIAGYSSIFLDLMRLSAALVVVFFHAKDQWFPEKAMTPSHNGLDWAHAGVVVFFVISGFVISFTTTSNNRGPAQYAKARLSRLISMVIPALLITALVEILLSESAPALLHDYTRGPSFPRYILSGLFMNEIGYLSSAPPLNRPLWSLSYEFWYYLIFGLIIFRKNNYLYGGVLCLAALVAGPKILLLMPIWLAGVFAYKYHQEFTVPRRGWILMLVALCATICSIALLPRLPDPVGEAPFYFSNQFLSDYIIGIFFAAALLVMPFHKPSKQVASFSNGFRKIADLTFPVYILHHPLLILWRGIVGYNPHSLVQMLCAVATIIVIAGIIGIMLDKQRKFWSSRVDAVFSKGEYAMSFFKKLQSKFPAGKVKNLNR